MSGGREEQGPAGMPELQDPPDSLAWTAPSSGKTNKQKKTQKKNPHNWRDIQLIPKGDTRFFLNISYYKVNKKPIHAFVKHKINLDIKIFVR